MSANTPHKPHNPRSLETTTRINVNDTFGEEEITLVEEESPTQQSGSEADDRGEESITLRMRDKPQRPKLQADSQHRRAAIEKRLRAIEKKAGQKFSVGQQLLAALAAVWGVVALLGPVIRKGLKQIPTPKFLKNKRVVWGGAGLLFLIILLVVLNLTCGKSAPNKRIYHANALDASGLQALDLSSLAFKDARGGALTPQSLVAGQPFFVHFDILKWNEQPSKQLSVIVDVRVYAQLGKIELYKPNLVRYSQATNLDQDKVHVKIRFDFTKETPPGEYRLSFSVREEATAKVAFVESRVTIGE